MLFQKLVKSKSEIISVYGIIHACFFSFHYFKKLYLKLFQISSNDITDISLMWPTDDFNSWSFADSLGFNLVKYNCNLDNVALSRFIKLPQTRDSQDCLNPST